jgi:hypothetical protein
MKTNISVYICTVLLSMLLQPSEASNEKISLMTVETAETKEKEGWEDNFSEQTETEWNESTEQWRDLFDELSEHPIPINFASKEMLESIPFLSEDQTESLSYYVYRYGPVLNLSELLLVDGFDEQTLRNIKPFICLGDTIKKDETLKLPKSIIKYGKSEIQLSIGRVLQEKKGYIQQEDSTCSSKERYIGNPLMVTSKFGFRYKDILQCGIVMQKDAGERFIGKNYLPDYLSFHLSLRETGNIKSFIAGDYCLSFGQGLVCGNSFSLGKNFSNSNPEIYGQEIRRHYSSAESGFLRGIAFSIYLNKKELILTGFGSYRKLDGNVVNETFTSISETGLHRTVNETDNQEKIKMSAAGTHLSYIIKNAQFGFTSIYWHFSDKYDPEYKPYNKFYFRGKNCADFSINFRVRYLHSTLFGESAIDKNGKTAFIGGVTLIPFSRINFSFLARFYSPEYSSFYSNAFAEGSAVRNELGWFSSMEWRIFKYVRLNTFCDFFSFPWLSYGINSPSSGNEKGIQLIWQPISDSELTIRLRTKTKSQNYCPETSKYPDITEITKNQYRFKYTYRKSGYVFQTIFDLNSIVNKSSNSKTWGMALSQNINYKPRLFDGNISLSIDLFDAVNYDNRVFLYEKSLPGTFSMASLYGIGSKFTLYCAFNFTKKITFCLKSGLSVYSDRDFTGTGSEEAIGNCLSDIHAMLRLKF